MGRRRPRPGDADRVSAAAFGSVAPSTGARGPRSCHTSRCLPLASRESHAVVLVDLRHGGVRFVRTDVVVAGVRRRRHPHRRLSTTRRSRTTRSLELTTGISTVPASGTARWASPCAGLAARRDWSNVFVHSGRPTPMRSPISGRSTRRSGPWARRSRPPPPRSTCGRQERRRSASPRPARPPRRGHPRRRRDHPSVTRNVGPAPLAYRPDLHLVLTETDLYRRQCHAERDLADLGRRPPPPPITTTHRTRSR